jgi:uncharacterized protein
VRLSGTTIVPAPPDLVRAALTDPELLAAAIPGCGRFERTGPDGYQFTVTGRVAAIEGSYSGQIRLEPERTPTSLTLTLSCAGEGGTVGARVHVRLTADTDGLTQLSYDADADIGGALAGVGQLMLTEAGRRFAAEVLSGIAPPEGVHAPGGQPAPVVPGPGAGRAVAPARVPPDGLHNFALGMVAGAAIAVAAALAGSRCGRQAR